MKFAFITPRYGAEITTGPEHACRLLAEEVAQRHDVDVITTCARNAQSWKNEYAEGADKVRGVVVRRFATSQAHDPAAFQALSARLVTEPLTRAAEMEWVRLLGPSSPGLLDHLKRQHRSYDALMFFSLEHATSVHGLGIAPERSVLFPYVRLSPSLRFGLWPELLRAPRGVGLFSESERRLIHQYIGVQPPNEELVGIGVNPPPQQTYPRHQQNPADVIVPDGQEPADPEADDEDSSYLAGRGVPFRRRHRIYGRMVLYGGKVESDNGCEEMLEYFDAYHQGDDAASLVLMGVKMMKVPEGRHIRHAGVLADRERMTAFEAAIVTIAPASDDLLAHPLLQSLAVGTPVLASARNESAVEHLRRANAGLYYANRDEFVEGMRVLMTNERVREALGQNGREYMKQHYQWDAVLSRFERLALKARRN